MVVVAIAGGLGDVGRTIVEEIARRGDHEIYVLTRKTQPGAVSKRLPVNFPMVLRVDYASKAEICKILREYRVNTVVSALNLHWPGAAESQISLIRASAESAIVEKFIPSEFNIDYSAPEEQIPYPPRAFFLQAVEELNRHANLTYSLARNGFFMDYLGLPFADTHLHPLYCLLDIKGGKAVLPSDATHQVVFTHTRDIGKYLNGLLKLPRAQWPTETAIIGERISLGELVAMAGKYSVWSPCPDHN